jgi:coenzyme F420-reducing hydrogenase alpha subunit
MKTTKIIKNKKEVMKELLNTMYESACAQKELLELLLEEYETEETKQTTMEVEPRELIKGINGLAEFLGCGSTKAQNIMNSGILQERDIAYRAGNRWRFNKTLLTRLLDEEPEILNRVCSEAEAA